MLSVIMTCAAIGLMGLMVRCARSVHADLKCGDAPMHFDDGLVVTWAGPAPEEARVKLGNGDIFTQVEQVTGSGIPAAYPEKYLENLRTSEVFNASMAWTSDELVRWQERHGIEMEPEAMSVFQNYLDTGHRILMTLVDHPNVSDPGSFVACSLVLQRAVIVYNGRRQDLFLRSYFHSARTDSSEYVNFAPGGSVHYSFKTDTAWFPLELTRLISEPASYVELDIVTPEEFDEALLPAPFSGRTSGPVLLGDVKYQVRRASAVFKVGAGQQAAIPDFRMPLG
ncbi:hypothetical protein [Streptomyces sp. NRRL S-87]|uniref:hypothetical protein n=1 Tax=Streptomyces sp. NRRL S-87 TaxID=1463920 RepID=UPI0004BE953C|nr:hypothetical protein [Streptomyces sp. NRRL S-87]